MSHVPGADLPIIQHLTELRSRMLKVIGAVLIGMMVGLSISDRVFAFLAKPLIDVLPETDRRLVFTSLPEVFVVYFKVAIFSGIILACPVIFYQVWRFIEPALYDHERRSALPFVAISTLFFLIGSAFCYWQVFPWGFRFFISLSSDTIQPMLTMNEYLKFSTTLILIFGAIFEMPVLLSFLAKLGIVRHEFLSKQRKYAIVIIFVIAAILTPPDVLTQVLMALPMMLLYEISILGAKLFGRSNSGKHETEVE